MLSATYTLTPEAHTVKGYHRLRSQSLKLKSLISPNDPAIGFGSTQLDDAGAPLQGLTEFENEHQVEHDVDRVFHHKRQREPQERAPQPQNKPAGDPQENRCRQKRREDVVLLQLLDADQAYRLRTGTGATTFDEVRRRKEHARHQHVLLRRRHRRREQVRTDAEQAEELFLHKGKGHTG